MPAGLADRVRDTDYKDAWGREIERTAEVRAILQDLIAELRGYRHRARNDMADHYEQRLREVLGE